MPPSLALALMSQARGQLWLTARAPRGVSVEAGPVGPGELPGPPRPGPQRSLPPPPVPCPSVSPGPPRLPSPCPHLPPVALSLFLPPLSPSPFFSVSLLVLVSLCPRPSLAVGLPLCPFPALRLMCVPAPPPVFLSASYPSARSASASLSLHPSLWPHPDFRLPRPAPTPLSPPSSPSPSLSSPPVGHRWDPSS